VPSGRGEGRYHERIDRICSYKTEKFLSEGGLHRNPQILRRWKLTAEKGMGGKCADTIFIRELKEMEKGNLPKALCLGGGKWWAGRPA